MAEETWHEARLIPTSGINGADEQERRATSALLAVISAVKEFGRALRSRSGHQPGPSRPTSRCRSSSVSSRLYPDGLIRVTRGSRSWTALVEVKTGTNALADRAARELPRHRQGAGLRRGPHHLQRDPGRRRASTRPRSTSASSRKVALHHLSWTQVLAEAVMQKEFRASPTPTRRGSWASSSATSSTAAPGRWSSTTWATTWVPVRDAVAAGTLRATDKGAADVVARFDALLRFASLRLGRQLGTEVVPVLSRKEQADPALRAQALPRCWSRPVSSSARSGSPTPWAAGRHRRPPAAKSPATSTSTPRGRAARRLA